MKVYLPYPKSTITQKFGDNATSLYATQGLKGHPAYDWGVPYATPIPNCVDGAYCYSVMHKNDPVLMDYRAAFFIFEDATGTYEISYGHMSEIIAVPGKTYRVGETIGLVGNTGPVYTGQHEVTETEKDAGSHAGAHLHGPQIRVVHKTLSSNAYQHYLTTEKGYYVDKDGYFYAIPDYDNGYNGCVSMAAYATGVLATEAVGDEKTTVAAVSDVLAAIPPIVKEIDALPPTERPGYQDAIRKALTALGSILSRWGGG